MRTCSPNYACIPSLKCSAKTVHYSSCIGNVFSQSQDPYLVSYFHFTHTFFCQVRVLLRCSQITTLYFVAVLADAKIARIGEMGIRSIALQQYGKEECLTKSLKHWQSIFLASIGAPWRTHKTRKAQASIFTNFYINARLVRFVIWKRSKGRRSFIP